MSSTDSIDEQVGQLLGEFQLYDRNVDVVSAWELIFVHSDTPLRQRVRHFERFPSIMAPDGSEATPDFSVVFDDSTGLVCEVANFALVDESVDSLCEQIARYAALHQLPVGAGAFAAVTQVDVMLLVPFELGTAAVQRVITERFLNPSHPYKSGAPPVIVQFTFSNDRYTFQRRPDGANGQFRDEGAPSDAQLSSAWFGTDDVKVKPERFREIKVARAFVNDPISTLYLATFLWAKTFAVLAASATTSTPAVLEVTAAGLAEDLRRQHGQVRARDVEAALELLGRGKLAERTPTGWVIYWTELHRSGTDRDLADVLARRSVRPPRRSVAQNAAARERAAEAHRQERLF